MSVSNSRILNQTFEMALKYGGGSFRDLVHFATGDPTGFSHEYCPWQQILRAAGAYKGRSEPPQLPLLGV